MTIAVLVRRIVLPVHGEGGVFVDAAVRVPVAPAPAVPGPAAQVHPFEEVAGQADGLAGLVVLEVPPLGAQAPHARGGHVLLQELGVVVVQVGGGVPAQVMNGALHGQLLAAVDFLQGQVQGLQNLFCLKQILFLPQ